MDMDYCSLGWSEVLPSRKVIYIAHSSHHPFTCVYSIESISIVNKITLFLI